MGKIGLVFMRALILSMSARAGVVAHHSEMGERTG